jgi:hypothetical protein
MDVFTANGHRRKLVHRSLDRFGKHDTVGAVHFWTEPFAIVECVDGSTNPMFINDRASRLKGQIEVLRR